MDLTWTATEEAFRAKVRRWLDDRIPREWPAMADRGLGVVDLFEGDDPETFAFARSWQATLLEGGYLALHWPAEHGGAGASLAEQVIFAEEAALAGAPAPANQLGLNLLGPTLMLHGTPEQQARFLPKILSAEEIWCQGYSEPGAGSDLAAVATRAERIGDDFVINGQKIWTTMALFGDWIFMLARTDPTAAKHRGLSYLLVDMRQPGVEVRALRQLSGSAGFGEVFFTDARTPASNLVGELNGGWAVATTTLAFERGASLMAQQVKLRRLAQELVELAEVAEREGHPALEDASVRQAVGRCLVDVEVMRCTALRSLSPRLHSAEPGPESSTEKLASSEWWRRATDVALEILGPWAAVTDGAPPQLKADRWILESFASRASTIYSGTSEIQRTIVAERVLGLPRGGRG